jgi:4-oxalomesaconate hydratase
MTEPATITALNEILDVIDAHKNRPLREPIKILAVSAHPADFCSRAGGTLIKHVQAGDRVKVIWLTSGETDESHFLIEQQPGLSVDEVRRIREAEAFACAEIVGAEGTMMGYSDNPLRMTRKRIKALAKEMEAFGPDILLTHWKDELTYPTHRITVQAVLKAAQMVAGLRDIRFFEPNIGTAARVGFVPDHYVDISDVFELKIEALKTLKAQPVLVERYTTCNRWRGIEVRRPYAEGFVRFAPVAPALDLLTDS